MIWVYRTGLRPKDRRDKRRIEHEAGLSLLYEGLRDHYGFSQSGIATLSIGRHEHGKPYLAEYPSIHFNISHCDGMAVCAVGDKEVGIDVERARPYRKAILYKVLTPGERRQLEMAPLEFRQELFFRFWTLKESYVKAVGCGITIPLTDVEFEIRRDGGVNSSVKGYDFQQQTLAGSYVISVSICNE